MKSRTLAGLFFVLSLSPLSCGDDSSGTGPGVATGNDASAGDVDSPDALPGDSQPPQDSQPDGPTCGDGDLGPGETCDGDCPTSCDDGDGCTEDVLTGSALLCNVVCKNTVTITTCVSGDGCCAAGCTRTTDSDCPYHVDSTEGDDANDGLTPQTAWKTVAKVNATAFVPGDSIAFKRGGLWRESLRITSKGTKDKPIIFRSYGAAAAKPVISPTRVATQWTPAQDSMYVADLEVPTNQVVVDGVRLAIAHHPNTGYFYIDADEPEGNKASFEDSELAAFTKEQLVGADIDIRAVRWAYDQRTVADLVGQRVTLDAAIKDWGSFHENTGYLLSNKLWMLDSPGEWFYDAAAKKLYVRLADDSNPASHAVEVSEGEFGIRAEQAVGIVLNGLEVRHPSRYGIQLTSPSDSQVKNCTVLGSGGVGLLVDWPPAGAVVDVLDNIVRHSALQGLVLSADTAQTQKLSVRRNQVFDTMRAFPVVGRTGVYPSGSAIGVHGGGHTLQGNTVRSAGYNGFFIGGKAHVVEQNLIEQCCLLLDDCGGIYLGGDSHVVRSNILRDMIGNAEGVPAFFTTKGTAAQGIYPDDRSHDIVIEGNTVVNADLGYQIHNSYANRIRNNTSYGCRERAIWFSEDEVVNIPGFVHDNITEDNIFFPSPGAVALGEGGWLGVINFGSFERNRYWHAKGELPIFQSLRIEGQYEQHEFTLQQWRDATGYDLLSKDIAETYVVEPTTGKPKGTSELISNGTFDSATTGWSGWPAAVALSWAADCGLTGGCLRFVATPPSAGALVSSSSFAVTQGTGYQVRFSARANANDNLTVVVRRNGDPWDHVGLWASAAVGDSRTDFVFVFAATSSATVRLDFGWNATTQFSVDDVSVREVDIFSNDPADDSRILLNPSDTELSVELQGVQYCDVDNEVVAGTAVLPAHSSKILLSCFCNKDYQCNNKETSATCPQDCP
jgi:parallel beta-helix repeat protein